MFVPGSTEDSRLVAEAYREYLTETVWKNVWNREMFEINVWNKLFSIKSVARIEYIFIECPLFWGTFQ